MEHFESQWKTPYGTKLYFQSWKGMGTPKGVVCLVHGLGEHTGRYAHVAQAFTDAGFDIIGFDLPGHGKSDGVRGDTGPYERIMEDISHLLAEASDRYPGVPRFLYGHSMGGNLVLYYLLKQKPIIRGAIVSSPGLQTGEPVSPVKIFLGKVMNSLAPHFIMDNGLDLMNLSHDPKVIQAYKDDPLVHPKISAQLGIGMLTNGKWIIEHAAENQVPLLVMQGSADHIVSPTATKEFASKVTSPITYKVWEGLYHETHNEPQKAEVIQTMVNWLNQQVTAA